MKYITIKNVIFVIMLVLIVVISKSYNNYGKNMNIQSNKKALNIKEPVKSTIGETYKEMKIADGSSIEQEAYDKNSIYFNGMEKVYSILKYDEVENIKVRLLVYIKEKVNRKENECIVTILENSPDTLKLGLQVVDRNFIAIIPKGNPSAFKVLTTV